jgi:RND superfamily putative drug exporter
VFSRLGSFSVRFRWYIIAAWAVVAVVLTLVAPNIDDVAVTDQRAFLSQDVPSLQANELLKKYFPDQVALSSAVLVVDAGPEGDVTSGAGADLVDGLTSWLTSGDAPAAVDNVWSPTHGDELTRAGMTSDDQQVAMILVRFNAVATEPITQDALTAIRARLDSPPAGLQAYLTGDGAILDAYSTASLKSMDSVTLITIVLVLVILLLIYRSLVSPFIPLATIGLSYLISRGVIAFLGSGPLTVSMYTNVFLIVVLFGAGTDYCLFLISRFREEMTGASLAGPAVKTTVRAVGETIASSAGTVIVGLAMMVFAELGLYNTTGPAIAIGVGITLLAGLALIPALLAVLGHRAFWPRKAAHMADRGLWPAWAKKVVKHPVIALVVPVIVLVPLAWYGSGLTRDFDMLADLPKKDEARLGFDVLAEHLGAGNMRPLNVLVVERAGFDTPEGLERIEGLQATLQESPHVAEVRSFMSLLPDRSTLSVAVQLTTLAEQVQAGAAALRTGAAATAGQTEDAAAGLIEVFGYLTQLSSAYPEVLQDPGYQQAAAAMAALSQLAGYTELSAGERAQAAAQLESLAEGLQTLQAAFAVRPDATLLPDLYLKRNQGLDNLRNAYFSADGTVARLQVVLDSGPYSEDAIDAVSTLQRTLADVGFEGAVEGNSAVLLDLRDGSDRDLNKAIIFVLGGILVVLILLLRALVAPIYLILTILLSYSATLGVVRLLFVDALGGSGITWWVPMFMFVMLVALGMDYNIFLIGRVKEEVAVHGTRQGTRLALARTGGIITSAGIIMAGTFASMMAGSLLGLRQIGFAVTFGVLLDTFVVRTTLVPAITVLLGRWSWWPRRGPGKKNTAPPTEGTTTGTG